MKPRVTVIDYGVGNLLSVTRALEYCGAEVSLTDSPDEIIKSERLVLPGVGAFEDGMKGLRDKNLIDAIKLFAEMNKPFLGICLGMQLMLDSSEEFGNHMGLGLISGKVQAIPNKGMNGESHKIPHIGWAGLQIKHNSHNTILSDIPKDSCVYFVHSFCVVPSDDAHRLADCTYNGRVISASIHSGNIYGCQFHPEKSGEVGLKILSNFIAL